MLSLSGLPSSELGKSPIFRHPPVSIPTSGIELIVGYELLLAQGTVARLNIP